jgi:hypothetical protein
MIGSKKSRVTIECSDWLRKRAVKLRRDIKGRRVDPEKEVE